MQKHDIHSSPPFSTMRLVATLSCFPRSLSGGQSKTPMIDLLCRIGLVLDLVILEFFTAMYSNSCDVFYLKYLLGSIRSIIK